MSKSDHSKRRFDRQGADAETGQTVKRRHHKTPSAREQIAAELAEHEQDLMSELAHDALAYDDDPRDYFGPTEDDVDPLDDPFRYPSGDDFGVDPRDYEDKPLAAWEIELLRPQEHVITEEPGIEDLQDVVQIRPPRLMLMNGGEQSLVTRLRRQGITDLAQLKDAVAAQRESVRSSYTEIGG